MAERVAIVVGGSSGIGAAARSLAAQGWHVHVIARRGDRLQALATEIDGSWATADASDPEDRTQALESAIADVGPPMLAVYAAGVLEVAAVVEQTLEQWRRAIDLNLTGAFVFAKTLTPRLPQGSRLVFISWTAGHQAMPYLTAYSASKGGLIGFADALGRELKWRGIGVHVIAPGPIATEMLDRPGTPDFQLDAEQVGDVTAWLGQLPREVLLRELELRVAIKGPFARSRQT